MKKKPTKPQPDAPVQEGPAVRCAHTEMRLLADIKPNPRNPNRHPARQIELLAKIIQHQGWRAPIVISKRSGLVVKGHGRLEAAHILKVQSAPVDIQEYQTEADELADMIADNKIAELAELDHDELSSLMRSLEGFDLSLTGFDGAELDAFMVGQTTPKDAEPKIDQADALAKAWGVQPGQIWAAGDHRIMCGDSTSPDDVQKLGIERAALCFTSPPYSDQREYKGGDLSIAHIVKFIRPAACCSALVINLGISRKNGEVVEYWNDYIAEARAAGLKLLSWNVWDQGFSGSVGKLTAMFPICHEWIFVFGQAKKKLNATVANKTAGTRRNRLNRQSSGDVTAHAEIERRANREIGTVISTPPQLKRDDYNHPARFPVALVVEYLRAMTHPGEVVYEPFSGSGTTLIACEQQQRKCRAMEISPGYVAVALQRFKDATGKTPKLIPTTT